MGLQDKQAFREAWDPRVTWGPEAWPCTAKWSADLSFSFGLLIHHMQLLWSLTFPSLNVFVSRVQLVLEEKKEILGAPETGCVKTAQKMKNSKTKQSFDTKQSLQPVCSSMKGSPGPPGPKGQEGAPGPKVVFL